MRRPLIAGNFKMFKSVAETVSYVSDLRALAKDARNTDIVIAPPFTSIAAAAKAAEGSAIGVAGQNMHWEREGAFTGEISADMLREAGADYVIIGHSERRRLFGETDETVNRKLVAALGVKLTPIVCIGETLEEREAGQMLSVLDRQIKAGLDSMTSEQVASLVLAYEPVWAIGTGRNATPAEAAEAHDHIRGRLRQWFGGDAADHCHVIYGGSVKPDNIHELVTLPDVDGALVGGASLEVRGFFDIVARSRHSAV
jgi:triosephosphate isomerase